MLHYESKAISTKKSSLAQSVQEHFELAMERSVLWQEATEDTVSQDAGAGAISILELICFPIVITLSRNMSINFICEQK